MTSSGGQPAPRASRHLPIVVPAFLAGMTAEMAGRTHLRRERAHAPGHMTANNKAGRSVRQKARRVPAAWQVVTLLLFAASDLLGSHVAASLACLAAGLAGSLATLAATGRLDPGLLLEGALFAAASFSAGLLEPLLSFRPTLLLAQLATALLLLAAPSALGQALPFPALLPGRRTIRAIGVVLLVSAAIQAALAALAGMGGTLCWLLFLALAMPVFRAVSSRDARAAAASAPLIDRLPGGRAVLRAGGAVLCELTMSDEGSLAVIGGLDISSGAGPGAVLEGLEQGAARAGIRALMIPDGVFEETLLEAGGYVRRAAGWHRVIPSAGMRTRRS